MQKQEFEERIERTVTDEQYKVIEEVYMWHPSIRNTSGKDEVACLLFGFCDALQIRLQLLSPSTPYQILQMIPYLCTLFVLAFFGIKKSGPKANGQPYYREER